MKIVDLTFLEPNNLPHRSLKLISVVLTIYDLSHYIEYDTKNNN